MRCTIEREVLGREREPLSPGGQRRLHMARGNLGAQWSQETKVQGDTFLDHGHKASPWENERTQVPANSFHYATPPSPGLAFWR